MSMESESGESSADLKREIELVPLDEIFPYVNNPKQHPDPQVQRIKSSILNFGWDQPIVIDGDGEIIKGHGRYEAAKDLDLDRVPVIRRDDLSDADKRAARIADNKSAESEWQEDVLLTEIEALDDLGFTAEDLGFDDDSYGDLLDGWDRADDLGMDSFGAPDDSFDTSLTLSFEDELLYDDVVDWFSGMMREHGLGTREEVIEHLVEGGKNAGF